MLTPITLIPIEKLMPVIGTFPVVKMAAFMVPERASGSGSRYFFAFSDVRAPRFSISWAAAGNAPNARTASTRATDAAMGRFMGGSPSGDVGRPVSGTGGIGATKAGGRGLPRDLRTDPSSLGFAAEEVNPNRQRATLTAVTFAEM